MGQDDAGKSALRNRHGHRDSLVDGLIHGRAYAAEEFRPPLFEGTMGYRDDLDEPVLEKANRHPLAAQPGSELGSEGRCSKLNTTVRQHHCQQCEHILTVELGARGLGDGVQDRPPLSVDLHTLDDARPCNLRLRKSEEKKVCKSARPGLQSALKRLIARILHQG